MPAAKSIKPYVSIYIERSIQYDTVVVILIFQMKNIYSLVSFINNRSSGQGGHCHQQHIYASVQVKGNKIGASYKTSYREIRISSYLTTNFLIFFQDSAPAD